MSGGRESGDDSGGDEGKSVGLEEQVMGINVVDLEDQVSGLVRSIILVPLLFGPFPCILPHNKPSTQFYTCITFLW